jgi:hypothetical protein
MHLAAHQSRTGDRPRLGGARSVAPATFGARAFQEDLSGDGGEGSTGSMYDDDDRTAARRFDIVANDWVKHHLGSLLPSTPHTISGDMENHETERRTVRTALPDESNVCAANRTASANSVTRETPKVEGTMTQDQMFDHNDVEKRHNPNRHRVKIGVPLVRRPAPATRAAEVVDVHDDDVEDRGRLNGRKLQ